MSILFLISLAMQSAEPTLTAVEVPVDQAVNSSPRYPYEVKDQVGAYLECLSPPGQMRPIREGVSQVQEAREDISRCDEQEAASLSESVQILAEGGNDEGVQQRMSELYRDLGGWHVAKAASFDAQLARMMAPKSSDEE